MKLKQLSKARKINAAIWAVIAIAVGVCVYNSWSNGGCTGFFLWLGVLTDSLAMVFLGYGCDRAIRYIENQNKNDKYDYC